MAEKRPRSPNFPYMELSEAVGYVEKMYKKDKLAFVPMKIAHNHMGIPPTSSTSRRKLSALTEYDLLEDRGEGQNKQLKISDLAKRIIIDVRPDSKLQNLRKAALSPPMMRKAWETWQWQLPIPETIKSILQLEWGFTDRAANLFASVVTANFSYAQLNDYYETNEGVLDNTVEQNDDGLEDRLLRAAQTNEDRVIPSAHPEWLDFSLSLGANQKAILYVSNKLSDDDFEYLVNWVKRMGKDIIKDSNSEEENLNEEENTF